MEFAAGIYAAIAVLQEDIYHPAMMELLELGGQSFLRGLNVFDNFAWRSFVHIFRNSYYF